MALKADLVASTNAAIAVNLAARQAVVASERARIIAEVTAVAALGFSEAIFELTGVLTNDPVVTDLISYFTSESITIQAQNSGGGQARVRIIWVP